MENLNANRAFSMIDTAVKGMMKGIVDFEVKADKLEAIPLSYNAPQAEVIKDDIPLETDQKNPALVSDIIMKSAESKN